MQSRETSETLREETVQAFEYNKLVSLTQFGLYMKRNFEKHVSALRTEFNETEEHKGTERRAAGRDPYCPQPAAGLLGPVLPPLWARQGAFTFNLMSANSVVRHHSEVLSTYLCGFGKQDMREVELEPLMIHFNLKN